MKRAWIVLGLPLAVLASFAAHAANGLESVLACMRANVPATARAQQIEVTATDRNGGIRVLTGKLYAATEKTAAGPRLRTLLKMDAPSDLAGAAYLLRESEDYLQDGMYVYLPSVRRVRRVSGTFADGALLGTNFSYNDFRQVQTAFIGAGGKLDGNTTLDGRAAYKLSITPGAEAKSPYTEVRVWVDQQSCVPLKAEFRKGPQGQTLVKELTVDADSLQKVGKSWYGSVARMRDLADGSNSVLRLTGTQLGAQIPPAYFDAGMFYR